MELSNFNRKYELLIGLPPRMVPRSRSEYITQSFGSLFSSNNIAPQDVVFDYRKEDRAVLINDLHFEADIKAHGDKSNNNGNNATITIFNLSPQTLEIISQKNAKVILKAAYEGYPELPIIYTGQVKECFTEKNGIDSVTTLQCTDGYTITSGLKVSKSFPPLSTSAEVINDFIDALVGNGLSKGRIITDEPSFPVNRAPSLTLLPRGWSYTGYVNNALDTIAAEFGYVWYITNSVVYFHPREYDRMFGAISLTTDLIHSIRRKQDATTTSSINSEAKKGVTIITDLDGRIDLSKRIIIEDGDYAGTYKVTQVEHKLSYRGTDWITVTECTQV